MSLLQFFKEIYPLIIFFSLVVFTSLQLIVTFRLIRREKKLELNQTEKKLGFSIVVAARNEEERIRFLLDSLSKLDYPKDLYEVIIVDDRSTDSMAQIIRRTENINGLKLLNSDAKRFTGKRGALQIGIENAKFEIIAATDADCAVPQNWLHHLNSKFSTGNDFVFGLMEFIDGKNFVFNYNKFDYYKNLILKIFSTLIGIPHSASGANLAFRKQKFFEVGGYEKTRETLSGDDDLLLRELNKIGAKIDVMLHPESIVKTSSKTTFKAFSNQRARHTHSSFHYLLPQQIFLTLWHLTGIISQYMVLYFWFAPYFLIPGLYKFFYEIIFALNFSKKFGYKFKLFDLILFPFIYEILLIVNYFRALSKKYHW